MRLFTHGTEAEMIRRLKEKGLLLAVVGTLNQKEEFEVEVAGQDVTTLQTAAMLAVIIDQVAGNVELSRDELMEIVADCWAVNPRPTSLHIHIAPDGSMGMN